MSQTYTRSGIRANPAIESVISANLNAGVYMVELDELGLLVDCDCEHAYALDLGCPVVGSRWMYDFAEHEFRALPAFEGAEPWGMAPEERRQVIALAGRIAEAVWAIQAKRCKRASCG